jgi:hypothetical protein
MNLTEIIESAEQRYRQILEEFFVSVYDGKNLPSHGIEHHRRVWNYARELLLLNKSLNISSLPDPSNLIIASFLHDIGMSVHQGPDHGKISSEMCLLFLKKNNLDINNFTGLLETIEHHDKKEYVNQTDVDPLLIYLSIADDLDAFGNIGIYRYSEIYLIRGIPPPVIGLRIRENASKRFDNFRKYFSDDDPFFVHHWKEYLILDNFFRHYNIQALSYSFYEAEPEAWCGIMQLFIIFLRNRMTMQDLLEEGRLYQDDVIISTYFKGLKSELDLN